MRHMLEKNDKFATLSNRFEIVMETFSDDHKSTTKVNGSCFWRIENCRVLICKTGCLRMARKDVELSVSLGPTSQRPTSQRLSDTPPFRAK